VGGDFGMVLAEIAAPLHQREHMKLFSRNRTQRPQQKLFFVFCAFFRGD
jgi:hypothetical protein